MSRVTLLLDSSHPNLLYSVILLNKRMIMNIQIESPHLDVSQIPEILIRKKFNHLAKLYDRIESCKVVLHEEKSDTQDSFFIEAILKVPNNLLFSSDTGEAFEITLEKVVHDLEKQLVKYKEKLQER